jgi:UDP-N-acetylmuramoyl-tripeptide--D-alanyl-D-alanine ligase
MIQMSVSEATALLGGSHSGRDAVFEGCSTDSRSIGPGELFVALRGKNFDAHDFVAAAATRGAAAAMVERGGEPGIPAIRVESTRAALGRLAAAWRERFDIPVVAVTGSNGKTTVKEMLGAVLAREARVLCTHGNLNNDVGLPLTLFRLDSTFRYAVVELGANHVGEIAALSRLARPQLGIVTQCAPAHLEGFGSIERVARAKGELFESLGPRGTAVINADDAYADLWRRMAGDCRQVTFGLCQAADVSATWFTQDELTRLMLITPVGSVEVKLRLLGRHSVMNALAATAAALALDVSLDRVQAGLESLRPIHGRLRALCGPGATRIIDDTYNANPTSLRAGLEVLSAYARPYWLVLGDMAELGVGAEAFHREAGLLAREHGVERLYCVGTLSAQAAETFGEGARHFESQEALVNAVREELDRATLLIKGSRSMRMERVVQALAVET